jgi:hypothetical protein
MYSMAGGLLLPDDRTKENIILKSTSEKDAVTTTGKRNISSISK